MSQLQRKSYCSPVLTPLRDSAELLAWAASRGTPEERHRVAGLADEMDRIQGRAGHPTRASR